MLYVRFFNELRNPQLSEIGGKGANLSILYLNGFPVPPGFCLTTKAYETFVETNKLGESFKKWLAAIPEADFFQLERLSFEIRQAFSKGVIPELVRKELIHAYDTFGINQAVAVRSSATAEDLPGLSFAGQQDTFLNVIGADCLIHAVIDCWSSLWTARAMDYRNKNGVKQGDVALSVVVQTMAQSQVSGVMFTTNPMNGKRGQIIVDATFGLGEALVSGQVEPDHYIIEDSQIIEKSLGDKALIIRSETGGGVQTCAEKCSDMQALPDDQILMLAELGKRIEVIYGAPQDIEWAYANDALYILQSRPITTLFPIPYRFELGDLPTNDKKVFFSFGSWQVMIDPISPAGRSIFYAVASAIGRKFGVKGGHREQKAFVTAGERLYVNISPIVRNAFGRKALKVAMQSIDPVAGALLDEIYKLQDYAIVQKRVRLTTLVRFFGNAFFLVSSIIRNEINPVKGKQRIEKKINKGLAVFRDSFGAMTEASKLAILLDGPFMKYFSRFLINLPAAVASGLIPFQVLLRLTSSIPDADRLVMELTRGMEGNVTTEMDLSLWRASQAIKRDAESYESFLKNDVSSLCKAYGERTLPSAAQSVLDQFINEYGFRGVSEIDIARERWCDNPVHILNTIKSYMEIEPSASPEKVFERSCQKAAQAEAELLEKLKEAGFNGLKLKVCRFMINRGKALGGLRETPKFTIVRILQMIRNAMLRIGAKACSEGKLNKPEDIFFLYIHEMAELDQNCLFREIIEKRKAQYETEKKRRAIPNLIEQNGTVYYETDAKVSDNEKVLGGSAVSAGIAEGIARVIMDPHETRLMPGEILVCPATDPAWTPLFLIASGLVMEVGGLFTHGSVVAREYGIPAVVGIKKVTEIIKTGQRIRVNGTSGVVEILE